MNKGELQQAQRLALLLSGSIKGGIYPPGHPATLQPMRELAAVAAQLAAERGEIRVSVTDGVLSVGDHVFFGTSPSLDVFARRMEDKGVRGIIFRPEVKAEELLVLSRLLADAGKAYPEVAEGLAAEEVTGVSVTDEEVDDPHRTYSDALEAIRDVFHELDGNATPNARRVLTAVKNLAAVAVKDPATLLGLAMIKDYDNYTFTHSVNVGVLAMALAAAMGLSRREIEECGTAGFLHDVGKTAIDKAILNKPGKLSAVEFDEMKRHPELGAKIVLRMEGIPPEVAETVLGHHIRQDRNGYPVWARDRAFGVTSAIVAVADCYDASTTVRVYQRPLAPKEAVENMRRLCGTHLSHAVVERFAELAGKYPVGSLVRLDSNEIAVVYLPSCEEYGAAMVKVIRDAAGRELPEPLLRRLSESGDRIVDLVDPLVKGVNVSSFL